MAYPICGPGRDCKLEPQCHLWEYKREAVSTESGALQDLEEAYKLRNSSTRGNKKQGASISVESLRKPQNLLMGLMEGISPQKAVKSGGSD